MNTGLNQVSSRRFAFMSGAMAVLLAGSVGCGAPQAPDEIERAEEGINIRIPTTIQPHIYIEETQPIVPIENRPLYIHFYLRNDTFDPLTGFVGAKIEGSGAAGKVEVDSDASTDWPINNLPVGATARGVVVMNAPYAARGQVLTVFLYKERKTVAEFLYSREPVVASAKQDLDVAARYDIGMVSTKASSTRGPDWAGAVALGDDLAITQAVDIGGNTIWSNADLAGNIRSGQTKSVNIFSTPFDLVPDLSPEMRYAYTLSALHRDDLDVARTTVNWINSLGAALASAFAPGGTAWGDVGKAHTEINNGLTEQCEGVLGINGLGYTSGALESDTQSSDSLRSVLTDVGTPSGARCGGISQYETTIQVNRLRWTDDVVRVLPAVAQVAGTNTVVFKAYNIAAPRFTVIGGSAKGFIGASTGSFTPASALSPDDYVEIMIEDTNPDESLRKAPGHAFVHGPQRLKLPATSTVSTNP